METDGAAAAAAVAHAAAAAGGQPDAANGRLPSESPLPEEEQAAAVAALSATAAAAQAAVAAQQAAAQQPAAPAEPQGGQEAAAAGADAVAGAGDAGTEPETAPATAPARVPARLLYGLATEEEAPAGKEAAGTPHDGRQQARLPQLPPQQDDGRLPAYAVGESAWHEPGARPGRKADHADEDPPEGFAPVDVFIGAPTDCVLACCLAALLCCLAALLSFAGGGCICFLSLLLVAACRRQWLSHCYGAS